MFIIIRRKEVDCIDIIKIPQNLYAKQVEFYENQQIG